MEERTSIIIGTRGSTLALAQTHLVVEALKNQHPQLAIEVKTIITKGDINQSPISLDTVGKDWFTAEIEQALINGEIDIAVHSMKDLPPETPKELITVPVLKRGDARDALVSKSGALLKDLPNGATIGTDSVRRKVLLLETRPDLVVKSIRGNVDTRLKKLRDESYDAIVLAVAGLERVGLSGVITEFLNPLVFIPAIGQGILAAQARGDRQEVLGMLYGIQDPSTKCAAEAEQAFSNVVGGGCKVPIGCYAYIKDRTIYVTGFIETAKGAILRKSASGDIDSAKNIAEDLARALLR